MGPAPGLGSTTFTVECWFRWNSGGSTASTGGGGVVGYPLVTKGRGEVDGNNKDANYFLGIDGSGRLVADDEAGAGQTSPGTNHPITGAKPITRNDGVWRHAAATFDGTTWRLYLDGNLDGTVVVGSGRLPRSDSIQHFGVGTAPNSLGETRDSVGVVNGFFAGDIDEVRVWSVARSQADIQADRNRQLDSGTGLIGRWGFNEAAGTLAADSTAPAEDGTLESAAWLTSSLPPIGTSTCENLPVANGTACEDGSLCTGTDTCQAGVCLGGPATSCDDADACTADACDPLLGCVHDPLPPPPEAALDLGFTGKPDMEWGGSLEATHYAMYRGPFGGAPWSYAHTCLYPSVPSPSATDASTPPAAQGFYYLVSGRNECGEGTLGTNSAGQTRPNASPCP